VGWHALQTQAIDGALVPYMYAYNRTRRWRNQVNANKPPQDVWLIITCVRKRTCIASLFFFFFFLFVSALESQYPVPSPLLPWFGVLDLHCLSKSQYLVTIPSTPEPAGRHLVPSDKQNQRKLHLMATARFGYPVPVSVPSLVPSHPIHPHPPCHTSTYLRRFLT